MPKFTTALTERRYCQRKGCRELVGSRSNKKTHRPATSVL